MEMELHGLVEDVMGCGMVFNTGWMYTPFLFLPCRFSFLFPSFAVGLYSLIGYSSRLCKEI